MSVRVMAMVWDGYPGDTSSELLALLALADWSDDEGRCFPSLMAVGRKCRLSRSQAQRLLHRLIESGLVAVTENHNGGKPGTTRRYRIVLERLTGRMDATGSAHATGRIRAQDGSHGCVQTGRMDATLTIIDTSITTSGPVADATAPPGKGRSKGKRPSSTLQAFLDATKAAGEQAIPDADPIFAYVDQTGISREMLAVCWREFKERHLPTNKRQADWRAHFRNAVRRNWFGLWYLREGEDARWTTSGEQARRAAK